jgi:hypothetical protein
MPEKLVMHPDMKDEEWARWDYVLSELSKTTNLAPFCSGISTEQQSESDVLPYEYDTLKTNDQVNRDAASVVPTSIPATTAAPVQRIVRPNLFTVWSWNKSTHQYQSYLESVETVYSCDFLNLLWMKSRNARLPDQIEPIARFVCRKEIYDSGCGGILSQLEEILMEIYPDSFLFQVDQDSLEYSEFAPQPLCQGDLEVWLAQIRYSYHRIALEIDNHPEESIHDICRLFPCQKLHKTSGTSDDDVAKLRGDQAWLSLRYCVGANDQVNRAEATASTEAQNADAASVVPTSETADGGSGSTHCSFSAINFTRLKRYMASWFCKHAVVHNIDVANQLCELGFVVISGRGHMMTYFKNKDGSKRADNNNPPNALDLFLLNTGRFAHWFSDNVSWNIFKRHTIYRDLTSYEN